MKRNPIAAMRDQDLAELHSYLLLFTKIYDDCEEETRKLISAVRDIYCFQTRGMYKGDEEAAIKSIKNPRGAGRKKRIGDEDSRQVIQLRETGLSIREITRETGVPRSTVQRILSNI